MKPFIVQESYYLEVSLALMRRIKDQAEEAGVSPTKYIENLVIHHTKAPKDSPWSQPLPWPVEKRYIEELVEFYEEDLKDTKPSFTNAREMVAHMLKQP